MHTCFTSNCLTSMVWLFNTSSCDGDLFIKNTFSHHEVCEFFIQGMTLWRYFARTGFLSVYTPLWHNCFRKQWHHLGRKNRLLGHFHTKHLFLLYYRKATSNKVLPSLMTRYILSLLKFFTLVQRDKHQFIYIISPSPPPPQLFLSYVKPPITAEFRTICICIWVLISTELFYKELF